MVARKSETFDIVDEEDRVIGQAPRTLCHGDPSLVHRAAHVLLFDSRDRLLLQKRSMDKDVQPGRWDTSVGGHLDPGEDYLAAACREMAEELGVKGVALTRLYPSRIRNGFESENVVTFLARYDGRVEFARDEIDEVRFWSAEEIEEGLGGEIFTPNFEEEWVRWRQWNRIYATNARGRTALCAGDAFPDLFGELRGKDPEG
ncbi:MAG: NUDIX hydrolase [Desulfuromonas sp.]|uniref:NUDIX hydrolase n=1 Tax=Desulfuromonas sp. TaxID=892 RepID=UPI000CCA744E|nr:NUDIX domain-containing protein [Desulfuromonas sp.]PLX83360.1 MAG: NUDIX hydrolase [Desulfuromonas sp.]